MHITSLATGENKERRQFEYVATLLVLSMHCLILGNYTGVKLNYCYF
jgi:hypothetical protein